MRNFFCITEFEKDAEIHEREKVAWHSQNLARIIISSLNESFKLSFIMDLSNFTIPPNLFYSNAPAETWKPMRKTAPVESTKKFKTIGRKHRDVRRKTKSVTPALGRIGKVKRSIIKKILMKKKLHERALKEKSENVDNRQLMKKEDFKNNNNKASGSHLTQLSTKQNDRILLKEIKDKEDAIKKRLFSDEFFSRKRIKGSSFKFFKTKNARDEDESSHSDHSDDLVPEIKDYSDKQTSPNKSFVVVAEVHNEPRKTLKDIIDPAAFDEEETELDIEDTTTIAIESLLKNFDCTDDPVVSAKPSMTSDLDELIETLEAPSADQIETVESSQARERKTLDVPSIDKVEGATTEIMETFEEPSAMDTIEIETLKVSQADKKVSQEPMKKPKLKFMGLGDKQLQIDAGQKKFGLVECKECGFSYNVSCAKKNPQLILDRQDFPLKLIYRQTFRKTKSFTISTIRK